MDADRGDLTHPTTTPIFFSHGSSTTCSSHRPPLLPGPPDPLSCSRHRAPELLERANMLNCNPIITQIDTKCKLSGQDGHPVLDPELYRSLAGVLQYLTLIRPDLSYAIQQIYLFMHDPRGAHF
jgi:hypothetical protein